MKLVLRYLSVFLLILIFAAAVYKLFFLKAAFSARSSVVVEDRRLRELSGLVLSEKNKRKIWVHNDGERGIRLFLIDLSGKLRAQFKSDKQVKDWEDIALGQGRNGESYIYVGDIGDNYGNRDAVRIYRFPEPLEDSSNDLQNIEEFYLKYPDGSRDAEAMFVDPLDKRLYIISKREDTAGVYYTPLNTLADGDTTLMVKETTVKLAGTGILKWITAADISPDGEQILVRTYGKVFYWKRKPGQSVGEAMRQNPKTLYHKAEIQGEAIGFASNGKGFYTISEGKNPFLNYNIIQQ